MKKLISILCATVALSLFTSCSDTTNNTTTIQDSTPVTLQEKLNSANSGSTIDLSSNNIIISENSSYIVDKAITLKNGNLKNSSIEINITGVTLENLENISNISVSEAVENGEFTIENCKNIETMAVLGGGENSIHINGTEIKNLSVSKRNVRIVLDETSENSAQSGSKSKITYTYLYSDCKFDSKNSESSFGTVFVSDAIENLEFKGYTQIKKLISLKETSTITITITANVTISSASDSIKNNITTPEGNPVEEIQTAVPTEEEKHAIQNAKEEAEKQKQEKLEKIFKCAKIKTNGKEIDSPNFKIEKESDAVVFTNTAPADKNIWACYISLSDLPGYKVEQDKNYKLTFEIKADKPTLTLLESKDEKTTYTGNQKVVEIGTEYAKYSISTQNASYDWIAPVFFIPFAQTSKLWIKNYKIEEITDEENANFGLSYGIYTEECLKNASFKNEANNTCSMIFKENCGISLIPLQNPLDTENKFYKLTFKAQSDIECKKPFRLWASCTSDEYDTAGSNNLYFNTTPKDIVIYMPSYQINGEKYRIAHIYFESQEACTLRITNLNIEKTTIEEVLNENKDLSFYFAGNVPYPNWNNGVNYTQAITVPANSEECYGQFLLCDSENWNSKTNAVTSFRYLAENSGTFINARTEPTPLDDDYYNIRFSNTTENDIDIKFSLNDDYRVEITKVE